MTLTDQTNRFPAPKKMMQAYDYRNFSIVVFAGGRAMVHHANATAPLADCDDGEKAAAWIDDYLD
jgi:hypothetical protein